MNNISPTPNSEAMLFDRIHETLVSAGGALKGEEGQDLAEVLAAQMTEETGVRVVPNGIRNAIWRGVEGGNLSCSISHGELFGVITGIKVVENA